MMSRVVVPSQNQHFILSHLWPRTQIHLSVIENYSFSDKDGGEPGDESKLESADEEDKDEADVPEEEDPENDDDISGVRKVKERSGAGGAARGAQEEEEEEEEEELWSDDDDDARADDTANTGVQRGYNPTCSLRI